MFLIFFVIKKKILYSTIISSEQFYSIGGHLGHCLSDWRPNALGIKNFSYCHGKFLIYNLVYAIFFIQKAFFFLKQLSFRGSIFLYNEAGKFSINILKSVHTFTNVSYISSSWVGGTLTNFKETVYRLLRGKSLNISKKLRLYKSGLVNLNFVPEVVVSTSEFYSPFAVLEANKLLLPSVSVVDSNVKIVESTYPIILNDDSYPTIKYLFFVFGSSYWLGRADFAVRHLNLSTFFLLSSCIVFSESSLKINLKKNILQPKIRVWLKHLKLNLFGLSSSLFNTLYFR